MWIDFTFYYTHFFIIDPQAGKNKLGGVSKWQKLIAVRTAELTAHDLI